MPDQKLRSYGTMLCIAMEDTATVKTINAKDTGYMKLSLCLLG